METFDEVGLDARAEDGSLADLEHVEVFAFDEGAVETDIPELVHEDEEAEIRRHHLHQAVQESGLTRAQKP